MKKVVGILGGISQEASADFYSRFNELFKKRFHPKNNSDFPRIIINSISPEDLVSGDNTLKLAPYVEGLRFLEQESDVICMTCNTVHVYYEVLQKEISKPIINLSELVKKELEVTHAKTVTILATLTSIDQKLYVFEGIQYNSITNEEAISLGGIIQRRVVGIDTESDKKYCVDLFGKYEAISDKVLLGCTEISLILKDLKSDKKINPMDLLIDFIFNNYVA